MLQVARRLFGEGAFEEVRQWLVAFGLLRKALLEQAKDGRFFGTQGAEFFAQLSFGSLFQGLDKSAVEVSIDNVRVNVTFATDGRGVSQALRDGLDRLDDVLFRLRLAVKTLEFAQGHRAEDRAGPGAKIFGGEVLTRDCAQVCIHVI